MAPGKRPTAPAIAYIGLGSNLDGPRRHVERAMSELGALPATSLTAQSALYSSTPIGPRGQPDYVNAVACLETGLTPRGLLDALQGIELQHGRKRGGIRWGPRPLDLDILLYDELSIDEPDLRIPHPGIAGRAFVLLPLSDVAPPGLFVPGAGPLGRLLEDCPLDRLVRLGPA